MRLMFALVLVISLFPSSLHSEVLSSESYFTPSMFEFSAVENDVLDNNMPSDVVFTSNQLNNFEESPKQDIASLPGCTETEMKVFDKFLEDKKKSVFDKWGNNGIGEWQEYLDKIVADRIITYYSDKPANKEYREDGCRIFANYCKGILTISDDINRYPVEGPDDVKINKYIDENYTSKGLLVIFRATGLDAGLTAYLTAGKNDCDKDFFAQVSIGSH